MVDPYLNYCSLVWANTTEANLSRVSMLQKKDVRIIVNSDFLAHTVPIFVSLNILPFRQIYLLKLGVFMFKFLNSLLPNSFNIMFNRNNEVRGHNTRRTNYFHLDYSRTEFFQNTIRFKGPYHYNNIPLNITQSTSLSSFKNLYFKFLINLIQSWAIPTSQTWSKFCFCLNQYMT